MAGDASTLDWVLSIVGGARRVLEVGAGNGELAVALAGRGLDVTAIDVALREPQPAHPRLDMREADFLAFTDDPFDAVLFTSSLHHIAPVSAAVARARALVVPGGWVIADEFAHEVPDLATAAWYYDHIDLLAAAGVIGGHAEHAGHAGHAGRPEHAEHPGQGSPLDRWTHEHQHHPRLHRGDEMVAALEQQFGAVAIERGPYLYRWPAHAVTAAQRRDAIARHLLALERQRIADGSIRAVGLRLVARG